MKNKHELDNWSKLENLVSTTCMEEGGIRELEKNLHTNIHYGKFIDL